ncbi:unnamed protein product, partial [Heterotrigona itama]
MTPMTKTVSIINYRSNFGFGKKKITSQKSRSICIR